MATPVIVSAQTSPHRVPVGPSNMPIPIPCLDWNNGQVLSVGAGSVRSSVFYANADCSVEMCSTTDLWYNVAVNAVAAANTANNQFLPSGAVRYVYVPAGMQIAVVQNSASGNCGMLPALLTL